MDHGLDTWGSESRGNSCVGVLYEQSVIETLSSQGMYFQGVCSFTNFGQHHVGSNQFLSCPQNISHVVLMQSNWFIFSHAGKERHLFGVRKYTYTVRHTEKKTLCKVEDLGKPKPCLFSHTFVITRHLNLQSVRNRMHSQKQREKLKV